jgi:ATP-binding cassette subfamily C (CFTR/MRP) protein 1
MFTQRKKGLRFTDKRVRITTEVLQGIRLIKFYAWEAFYVQQIGSLRTKEIQTIRMSAYVLFFIVIVISPVESQAEWTMF